MTISFKCAATGPRYHHPVRGNGLRRADYHGWEQALGANPDVALRLNIDDWLFFFGR
jgi:hypothetical protein